MSVANLVGQLFGFEKGCLSPITSITTLDSLLNTFLTHVYFINFVLSYVDDKLSSLGKLCKGLHKMIFDATMWKIKLFYRFICDLYDSLNLCALISRFENLCVSGRNRDIHIQTLIRASPDKAFIEKYKLGILNVTLFTAFRFISQLKTSLDDYFIHTPIGRIII